jgi:predicted glycosyltransferase
MYKKVIVDFTHVPHINLLRNVIDYLNLKKIKVDIICLNRGKNLKIARKEFPSNDIFVIGKHRGNLPSIIIEANIIRFYEIIKFLSKKKYDIGLSAGSFMLGFGLKLFNIPNIQFYDDPENKKNMILQQLSATGLFYPELPDLPCNIQTFRGLKEWAYLSPKYFHPDISKLAQYNVEPKSYIFIREVSVGTSNYVNQESRLILKIAKRIPSKHKVLLSLEDKKARKKYPQNWVILKEPLSDIHSLMYYSRIVISSGDSMAREGAMLGVPSIYCGIREMAANKVMIDKGMLFHKDVKEVPQFIDRIINNDIKIEEQDKFRKRLEDEWVDVTEFIIRQIKKYG